MTIASGARSDVVERLRTDPILIEFARRTLAALDAGRPRVIERPADVLGELLMYQLQAFTKGVADYDGAPLGPRWQAGVALALKCAVPYLWDRELWLSASESTMPPHVISANVLPFPVMWWSFSNGVVFSGRAHGDGPERIGVDGLLIIEHGDGFEILGLSADDNQLRVSLVGWPKYGEAYDPNDQKKSFALNGVLSGLSFMASPYVGVTAESLSRAERRRGAGSLVLDKAVNVIRLRAIEHRSHESETGNEGTHPYSVRWMVRGHHRAQWYPSEQAHHVRWIAPYIKGPADKPFRQRLYRVDR